MSVLLAATLLASATTMPLSPEQVRAWSAPELPSSHPPQGIVRLAAWLRALQMERADQLPAARQILQAYDDGGSDPLTIALRFHAARLALKIGEPPHPSWRDLFAGPPGPTVRWGITRQQEAKALLSLAQAWEEHDQPRSATKVQRFVALEYPRWAAEVPNLSRADRRRRAENSIRDMDYEGALSQLKGLLVDAPPEEQRQLKRQIGRLLGDKMRDNYVRVAAIYKELAADPEASADDFLYYAYAVGKLDARASARVYEEFLQRFPSHLRRTKAAFMIAWTAFDLERFDQAVARLDAFLQHHPNSSYRFPARWYRGLALFQLGRYEEARVDFEYTARHTRARDRGLYWTARALLESGRHSEAFALLSTVAAGQPFSYYGILARALLPPENRPSLFKNAGQIAWRGLSAQEASQQLAALPPKTQQRLIEAFAASQLQHPDLAAALLAHVEENGLRDPSFAPLLAWLRPRLGAVHRHIRSAAARRCRPALAWDPVTAPVRDCWQALYPTPYSDLVEAVRGEVPASLFWAIMRQESFFMPAARSHADALGLMQVIPQVGGPAAEALGQTFAPYELWRPATNLAWFAHAANERHQRFGGHVPLMLMSYNATPEKARRWLVDNHDLPFDLFIEEIPYRETRDYVKRISSHLARYRTLRRPANVPLLERAGLPHPTAVVRQVFANVVNTLRDSELAQVR